MPEPRGLQLDLLTVIVRLEQVGELLGGSADGVLPMFGWYLLTERVIECDVPRLRGYLTAETLAWEEQATAGRDPVDVVLDLGPGRRSWWYGVRRLVPSPRRRD